jgi:hypothetical protein
VRFGWPRYVATAGFLAGLVLLAKAELFLALASALATGVVAWLWLDRPTWRKTAITASTLAGMSLLAPAIALSLLCLEMPPRLAAHGMLGDWLAFVGTEVSSLPFYRSGMGTLDVTDSLRNLLTWSLGYGLLFGGAWLWANTKRRAAAPWEVLATSVGVIVCLTWLEPHWHQAARPLPVAMLVLGITTGAALWRRPEEPTDRNRLVLRLVLIVFPLTATKPPEAGGESGTRSGRGVTSEGPIGKTRLNISMRIIKHCVRIARGS